MCPHGRPSATAEDLKNPYINNHGVALYPKWEKVVIMCSWVGISSVWLVGTNQFLMVGPRHSHHILLGNEAAGEDACFPDTTGDALYAFGQSEEEDACFPATAGDPSPPPFVQLENVCLLLPSPLFTIFVFS